MRRTKIVATLGPASQTREAVDALIAAGMDVARINFSHGNHDSHAEQIAIVRAAADAAGRSVAVLQDLQGPKIRTGTLEGGTPVELIAGETFTITTQACAGNAQRVETNYAALPDDLTPGDRVLLSDGAIALSVVRSGGTEVVTEVVHGGFLSERQGINLPGVDVSIRGVTDKDFRDLEFGLQIGVDIVAISFVRSADEVRRVQRFIAEAGGDAPVIAKLEKAEALEALDEIIDVADGVMVARGDLGVETAPEKVPLVQKHIIDLANRRAKPVITATQMLESMIENRRPTRAEASDVANAILDGSDAVMLSGETAVGLHPVEAVATMARIADEMQAGAPAQPMTDAQQVRTGPEAIAAAVGAMVESLPEIRAVWVFTQSGTTARLVARQRPRVPIFAFTPDERCYRRLALFWGVTPVLTPTASSFSELSNRVFPLAEQRGLAERGDAVVMTGSHPFDVGAPTNFLKVHVVGS
jgi:pyruvate kinase